MACVYYNRFPAQIQYEDCRFVSFLFAVFHFVKKALQRRLTCLLRRAITKMQNLTNPDGDRTGLCANNAADPKYRFTGKRSASIDSSIQQSPGKLPNVIKLRAGSELPALNHFYTPRIALY